MHIRRMILKLWKKIIIEVILKCFKNLNREPHEHLAIRIWLLDILSRWKVFLKKEKKIFDSLHLCYILHAFILICFAKCGKGYESFTWQWSQFSNSWWYSFQWAWTRRSLLCISTRYNILLSNVVKHIGWEYQTYVLFCA